MLFRRISLPLILAGFALSLSACVQDIQDLPDEDIEVEQEEIAPGAELCGDGIDNDGDGLIDCEDPDCDSDPFCAPRPEQCNNGQDDDGDGLIDCEDPDCAAFVTCMCEDSNAVFIDRQTDFFLTGTTVSSLDLGSFLACQAEGGTEVLFVLHAQEDTRLQIQLTSNADLMIATVRGVCDNFSGTSTTCTNRFAGGTTEELVVDIEVGRPTLLFVGGADATQEGPFILRLTAI
jgi:hypothetical protein